MLDHRFILRFCFLGLVGLRLSLWLTLGLGLGLLSFRTLTPTRISIHNRCMSCEIAVTLKQGHLAKYFERFFELHNLSRKLITGICRTIVKVYILSENIFQ